MSFISFIIKSPVRVTQLATTAAAAVGGGIISAKAAAKLFPPKRKRGSDPVPNNEDEGPLYKDKEDDEVDGDV